MFDESMTDDIVYFDDVLPPADAQPAAVVRVAVDSRHVSGALAEGGRSWWTCHDELTTLARERIAHEVKRRGVRYARVYSECLETRQSQSTGEAWLHGRFDCVLYREGGVS